MVKAQNRKSDKGSLSATVGGNVKRRREELGITQSQLAQLLGVEVETVSRYERGAIAPSFAQLEKMCLALGVPAWSLFSDGVDVPGSDGGTLGELLKHLPARDREFVVSFVQDYVEHHRPKK
ncbi:helix-turn-helix domain-containing protein [Paraburkholderia graminis]|jgi:transcriptional regulator with XRE-family HTH domain|uniref:helix-turn-helix domain-containing protein n=1 Tax=Paraburkholderia graminis TaxID=60548 RepID=UPI0038B9FD51